MKNDQRAEQVGSRHHHIAKQSSHESQVQALNDDTEMTSFVANCLYVSNIIS